jgi:hypothetical protein
MEEQSLPIRTKDGHTVVIDFFRPEDAPGIVDLFREVYGDNYPIKLYYDPDTLIRANAVEDCCSIVARNESDRVVGVTHVIRSSPYEGVCESAAGLVLRAYRSHGINNRLQWFLFHRWTPSKPRVVGIFGEPVCQHIHLQKNWHDLGAVEMGIELALVPAATFAGEKDGLGRVACLAAYRSVIQRPHRIYLPIVYTRALQFLYTGLDEPRFFSPSSEPLPQERRTEYQTKIFDFASVARVIFLEIGADLEVSAERMEQDVRQHGAEVIQVWLKLGSPWVGAAVDVFRNNGYFLGGVLPRWFDDDGLVLQKLFCTPCWEGIKLYTSRAKSILEIVRKDREGIMKRVL